MYTVPIRSALNVLDAAQRSGRPWELTDEVGIAYDRLHSSGERIALRQLVALYEAAARRTRDSTFGLRVGVRADPRVYDLMGYLITNSVDLGAALDSAARYLPLWTDGATIEILRDGGDVHVIWQYLDPAIVESRQDCEMSVLALAQIGLRFARGIAPKEVRFRHSAGSSAHRRLFGAAVRFNMSANGLVYDAAALRLPLPGADARLRELLVRLAEQRIPSPAALVDRVRLMLPARLESIARRLGMSVRSLERRLAARGTSLRRLQADERQRMAKQYLRDTDMSLKQVAARVGYASTAELHRAFLAWTGMTPGAYRKRGESADAVDDRIV